MSYILFSPSMSEMIAHRFGPHGSSSDAQDLGSTAPARSRGWCTSAAPVCGRDRPRLPTRPLDCRGHASRLSSRRSIARPRWGPESRPAPETETPDAASISTFLLAGKTLVGGGTRWNY
eukprot:scaffold285_cov304-Pinguiococcus_pyrenoidosus.AAC.29